MYLNEEKYIIYLLIYFFKINSIFERVQLSKLLIRTVRNIWVEFIILGVNVYLLSRVVYYFLEFQVDDLHLIKHGL